mgnify:CR=1 FL=1
MVGSRRRGGKFREVFESESAEFQAWMRLHSGSGNGHDTVARSGNAVGAEGRELAGLVLRKAHAESATDAGVDAVRVGDGEACLGVEAVVAVAEVALGGGIDVVRPGVGVEGDASPNERRGESNNQPLVLGINRIVRIPAELYSTRADRANKHNKHGESF